MSNLVIVAIPDKDDRVWKISSEEIPHMTLLFLGDVDNIANLEQIVLFVEHAASTTLKRFHLTVDRRGELGEDQADVLFFKKIGYDYKAIRDFRAALLQDNNIRTAYDSSTQFNGPWQPHLTLGYPETPAKPDEADYGLYGVGFHRIAVWTGDFDGPEFLLKDYWDEWETMENIPMDVAMSDLQHHGVKGMKWGVRKEDVAGVAKSVGRAAASTGGAVGKGAKAGIRRVGDRRFEKRAVSSRTGPSDSKASKARQRVLKTARKDFKSKDLATINAKPEYQAARKRTNRLLKPLDKTTRTYRGEVKQAYIKRLETTANSMKNPSGTREYSIRERGGDLPTSKYQWEVSTREARHAEGDDFTLVNVLTDDDGFIIDTEVVEAEDAMAQTADLGAAFLAHYGVKGMKWGVRNAKGGDNTSGQGETKREGFQRYFDPQGHSLGSDIAKSAVGYLIPPAALVTWPSSVRMVRGAFRGGKAKAIDAQEKRFAKNAMSPKNFAAIHNGSREKINRDVDGINQKYPNPNKSPATRKKYDGEVLKVMQDGYRASANSLSNRAQTMHLDVEFKNDGQDFSIHARQGAPTLQLRRVKHAAEDVADEEITVEITGKITRNSTGHILGLDFSDSGLKAGKQPAAHSAVDLGEEFILEHYGIKGMRWGVRSQREVTTQTHIDTGLRRRRTKIQTTGGEAHDAHPDAVKAAINKQKIKKSGHAALSTQELRDLANRLQVENQVSILMSSKGKQFVARELEGGTKQLAKKGFKKGAPIAVSRSGRAAAKKAVKKTAATVAVSALL